MGKVLGIDYGAKRTGIAITDAMQIVASGLTTIATNKLYEFITDIVTKENIDIFVVGNPKNLDGSANNISGHVNCFITKLQQLFPTIPVHQIDERFTSKIAKNSILSAGIKKEKRKDKSLVDMVSATIILQDYLDSRQS